MVAGKLHLPRELFSLVASDVEQFREAAVDYVKKEIDISSALNAPINLLRMAECTMFSVTKRKYQNYGYKSATRWQKSDPLQIFTRIL